MTGHGEIGPVTRRRQRPGLCADCRVDDHVTCIDDERHWCGCQCAAWLECDTCDEPVILMADDPDDPSYAHGECCTWGYINTFDGAIRLDLRETSDG